jgi:N-hydroxyarylamine O-acetyltransferase
MDVDSYLSRIGIDSPVEPTLDNLEMLQRAHLTAVPFENLHVFHRRGVKTTDDWTVSKIVEQGRGGWCFELNGAFASLLSALGYEVRRLAATVLRTDSPSPIPTHATIEVALDRRYLVDVGFGDSFIRPLPLDSAGPHDGGSGEYGFVFDEEVTTLVSTDETGDTVEQYRFDRTPHSPADFEEASTYLQTEPGLQWTTSRFATRLLDGGPDRVTLLTDRIKFRHNGTWTEEPIDEDDWADLLQEWFGMTP